MIELYLDNSKVDMNEDLKINMTYQQTDLEKPEAKLNNYSKSINIPGTNNNNNIFGHIFRFDTNIQNSLDSLVGVSFDPNKRIPFTILDNGALFETGYAQLDNISIVDDNITYSITLYGNIGQFFYNLKVNDNGSEKTLYDMYYGLVDLNGNKLNQSDEDNNILFEYNKEYVKKCWDVVLGKMDIITETDNEDEDISVYSINNEEEINDDVYEDEDGNYNTQFDTIPNNDIRKIICPIPCYQGYYDNFDNDVVLCEISGLSSDSVLGKSIIADDNRYNDWDGWVKAKLDREVSNFEINDIRSHYLPYAIRMQSVYDAIKNPLNNGGFDVDDTNISDIEKKYIYEAYIMQNPFEWDDVNANNINTTIIPTWSRGYTDMDNRYSNSQTIDLTKYINPNASLYVMPRLIFDYEIKELHTMASIYSGYNYERKSYGRGGIYYKTSTANAYFGESVQYFWAEAYDENNNLIRISDVYIYGDKQFDENGNPYFLYNQYGEHGDSMFSGPQHSELSDSPTSIKYFLDRNGLKLRESSLSPRKKPSYVGYYINDDDKGTAINLSHIEEGYSPNTDNKEYTGSEFKIDLKLDKNVKKVVIKSDAITTTWTAEPDKKYKDFPYSIDVDDDTMVWDIKPGFANFGEIKETKIKDVIDYLEVDRTATKDEVKFSNIMGMISGQSQIYDGSVETLSERHTVNKFTLFQNTKSPYDYLISMCKMFNWKIEMDSLTNKVMLYSHNNYYNNNIVDINSFVDYSTVDIIPTTSTSNIYDLSLEFEETYTSSNWYKANKSNYGEMKYLTNFEFGEEPNKVMEDVVFKNSIPYIQKSVFFNNDDKSMYPKPTLGKSVEVSMWDIDSNNDEKSEKRFGKLRDFSSTLSQNVLDKSPRLSFFDSEYSATDMSDTLVFFNVKNTQEGVYTNGYQLSDNIQITNQLNENNCYLYLNNTNKNVTVDIDNSVVGRPVYSLTTIPSFNTHFNFGDVEYYGTMKAEPLENRLPNVNYENTNDIYNICWKNYITDLYNKNNKIVTVKVRLFDKPINLMKQFYSFSNAIWVINKIIDYNVDDIFTKVEFIQVQDINNYIR